MSEESVRTALRNWVLERNPDLEPADLDDQTPLIEQRYLTSLQVTDLLVFIEELRQSPLDPKALRPRVFRSVDSIYTAFFAPAGADSDAR